MTTKVNIQFVQAIRIAQNKATDLSLIAGGTSVAQIKCVSDVFRIDSCEAVTSPMSEAVRGERLVFTDNAFGAVSAMM